MDADSRRPVRASLAPHLSLRPSSTARLRVNALIPALNAEARSYRQAVSASAVFGSASEDSASAGASAFGR